MRADSSLSLALDCTLDEGESLTIKWANRSSGDLLQVESSKVGRMRLLTEVHSFRECAHDLLRSTTSCWLGRESHGRRFDNLACLPSTCFDFSDSAACARGWNWDAMK